jgi:hypothetical protein
VTPIDGWNKQITFGSQKLRRRSWISILKIVSISIAVTLLMLPTACFAEAPEGFTGQWSLRYEVDASSPGAWPLNRSNITILQVEQSILGNATLGDRDDGYIDGSFFEDDLNLYITFSHEPSMILRLAGSLSHEGIIGRFNAASSNGKTWRGQFSAKRISFEPGTTTKELAERFRFRVNPMNYMTENTKIPPPEPEGILDYDAFWQINQAGRENKSIVTIKRHKNMVYSFRNVPFYNV